MALQRLFGVCLGGMLQVSAFAATGVPAKLDDGWTVTTLADARWDDQPLTTAETRIADGTWKGVTSLLVAHRGQLVYENYFNGGGRDVLNDTRSLTKTLTAMLVGAAIDTKAISGVQAKVYPFFDDKRPVQNADARKDAFTLEDLLTMSSLWECNDENSFSSGHEERMYVTEDWVRFALDLPIKGFAPWQSKPADSPHGRAFAYCTAGSFVLGAVVERATKKHLDAFSAEVLEKPLGIRTSKWNFSPDGTAMGGGGARFRSRDLARFGEVLRNGGSWNGRRVLSKAWVETMLTVRAQARDDAEYGYQIWRFHFPHHGKDVAVWAMSGNGGNYVFIAPTLDLVAVITSTAYNQRFAHPQSQEIFREIVLKSMP